MEQWQFVNWVAFELGYWQTENFRHTLLVICIESVFSKLEQCTQCHRGAEFPPPGGLKWKTT